MSADERAKRGISGRRLQLAKRESDLKPHGSDGRLSQRRQASEEFGGRRRFEEIFRDAHRGSEHAGIGIIEATLDRSEVERAEAFERPDRVQAGERRGRSGDDRAQGGHNGEIAALDEETLRGVAHPTVGIGEVGDST